MSQTPTAPSPPITTEELHDRVLRDRTIAGLLERRAAEFPDRTLLRWDGEDLSYARVDGLAGALAAGLAERGIGAGDRVAMMMSNSAEWVALWFAIAKVGATAVTVNTAHRGDGLAYILGRSETGLLAADAALAEHLAPLAAEGALPPTLLAGEGDPGALAAAPLADLYGEGGVGEVATVPGSGCSILFTSGTTGPPKGCLLPHAQYLAAAHLHAAACDYGEGTTAYTCLPLFHVNAQTYSLLSVLAAGGTLALDPKFSASRFWQRIVDSEATAFNFIGAMALALWNREPSPLEREHRATLAFGVPVPPEIWEAWEERFGVRIVYSYGMTENALPLTIHTGMTPVPPHLRGSSGVASPTTEVMIADDDGRPVPPDTPGEILTRPRIPGTMMSEYIGQPEATLEAFRDFWFHTGDIGRMDEDGFVFWLDRKKDTLRRRGEMVSSWEVEQLVSKFPGVAACAVVGVPSEMTEDDILVVVVGDGEPIDPAALVAFCEERTARFQVPRYVRIAAELPMTPTQRVEKYRLRAEGITAGTWDSQA
jgi:carnitine-CoA ligase